MQTTQGTTFPVRKCVGGKHDHSDRQGMQRGGCTACSARSQRRHASVPLLSNVIPLPPATNGKSIGDIAAIPNQAFSASLLISIACDRSFIIKSDNGQQTFLIFNDADQEAPALSWPLAPVKKQTTIEVTISERGRKSCGVQSGQQKTRPSPLSAACRASGSSNFKKGLARRALRGAQTPLPPAAQ